MHLAWGRRLGDRARAAWLERGEEDLLASTALHGGEVERPSVPRIEAALRAIRLALAHLEPALPRSFTYPEDKLGLARHRALTFVIRGGLHVMRHTLPRRIGGMLTRAQVSALTLIYTVVTEEIVEACHERGVAVWAWTVNDTEIAAGLGAMGADAIITDDPRIFRGPSDS